VPLLQLPLPKAVPHRVRQVQQPQRVRHRRPAFPHPRCHLLLVQSELVNQPPVRLRRLDRVDILPLEVLHQRQLQHLPVARLPDHRWHPR